MALFAVTLEEIETSKKHPNADRLSICTLKGMAFQFVTGLNDYKPGDKVVYFPLDAVIPQEVLKKMGLEGKLAGNQKNRVKTMRLRGEISQGIVANLSLIDGCATSENREDITKFLGVTKYEPPEVAILGGIHAGNLVGLPPNFTRYDIEGADRFPGIIEKLMDEEVAITEKVEGSQWSLLYDNGKVTIHTHNHQINDFSPSQKFMRKLLNFITFGAYTRATRCLYWEVAKKQKLPEFAASVLWSAKNAVTLYGEFVGPGVQGNIYKLKENVVLLFDIKIGQRHMPVKEFTETCRDARTVPVISYGTTLREFLNRRTVQEASNGPSMLGTNVIAREGIVIKPMGEKYSNELGGRLIIKQRSPEYLAKE